MARNSGHYSVRQELHTEHRERLSVPRKGFRKVSPQQARRQTIATLQYLRDESIRMARDSLTAGDWRAALTCLGKAAMYDDQSMTRVCESDVFRGSRD